MKVLAQDFTDDEVIAHFKAIEDAKKEQRVSITLPNGTSIRNSSKQLKQTARERINARKQINDDEDEFLRNRGLNRNSLRQHRRK